MDDAEFDRTLIGAAFALAGEQGWAAVNVPAAARQGQLSLARARERFPSRAALLVKFGRIADQAALRDPPGEGTVRDRLFYLIMQRLDVLQTHRAGVLALMRALPAEPPTALLLACATRRSMRWLLEAAGVSSRGLRGQIRVRGMMAVWLWALRTWQSDDSTDLSQTMSAVDMALQRAEQFAGWLGRARPSSAPEADTAPGEEIPSEEIPSEEISSGEIPQGEPPEPESPPSPVPPSVPPPPLPPTSLPPEPLA